MSDLFDLGKSDSEPQASPSDGESMGDLQADTPGEALRLLALLAGAAVIFALVILIPKLL